MTAPHPTRTRPEGSVIQVGTIAVGFDLDLDARRRAEVAETAFDVADRAARKFLPTEDFGIDAVVQPGSVDIFVAVVLSVPALLGALTLYGSAAEGLHRLKADLGSMRKYFVKEFPSSAHLPPDAFESSRLTTDELAGIRGYIRAVQSGEFDARTGAQRARAFLESTGAHLDLPTVRQLEESFAAIPVKSGELSRKESYDAVAGAGSPERDMVRRRKRVLRRRPQLGGVRVWRAPGESTKHREDL
jgi:hypothetical protein